MDDLLAVVEEHTGGNPMGPQKWVRRSLRNLCKDLARRGYDACATTVGKLLRERDYTPKANRKRFTGPRHPDRDRQFRWIARQRKAFLAKGLPVISVDLKKKELVGNFKNAGRSWCQEAEEVDAYDFPSDALGVALPYGIYLVNRQRGSVEVGTSSATPEFAVDVIARWWASRGRVGFPNADRLLILADSGGNNGCRPRLWKLRLQEQLADGFGLEVTVCHYPRGASKYNPVERRLFSRISDNWAGKPLRSYPVLLAYVRGTKTETGLRVEARLNRGRYRTKIKVSDQEMRGLNLRRHRTCPQWNYTIKPRTGSKISHE
jgi:Rhodopirellula transposase DDE domain